MKIKIIPIIILAFLTFTACKNTSDKKDSAKIENMKAVQAAYKTKSYSLPSFKLQAADGSKLLTRVIKQ